MQHVSILENAYRAMHHTIFMDEIFSQEIEDSYLHTTEYRSSDRVHNLKKDKTIKPDIRIIDMTSQDAVICYAEADIKTAVLNFANFCVPGGGFIEGATAQEETLCHNSFLYNVIHRHTHFYEYNKNHQNNFMYENRALYSPDVKFFGSNGCSVNVDVLTCASPNRYFQEKYGKKDLKRNLYEMRSRINFIRCILEENEVEIAILGAFGCGAFGQDAKMVARIFKEVFEDTTIKYLIFAIPDWPDGNYEAFKEVFENKEVINVRKD